MYTHRPMVSISSSALFPANRVPAAPFVRLLTYSEPLQTPVEPGIAEGTDRVGKAGHMHTQAQPVVTAIQSAVLHVLWGTGWKPLFCGGFGRRLDKRSAA